MNYRFALVGVGLLIGIVLLPVTPRRSSGTRYAVAYGTLGWTCTQNPGNEC